MKYLSGDKLRLISGGKSLVQCLKAVEVGLQIYQGGFDSIEDATKGYAQIGTALSEAIFNALHSNLLGKMSYTASDF